MKITHILETFRGGGKERRCLQLLQGLSKTGTYTLQVIIINNNISYKELESIPNCTIHIINRKELNKGNWTVRKELRDVIGNFNPDIVQAWGLMSVFFILLSFPFPKFKFLASHVADVIKPRFPTSTWFINQLCKIKCSKIIGNSKAGLSAYNIPKKKAALIYNGFNEERFNKIADFNKKRDELGINTKYAVIMVATFGQYKDYQCYLDAAKIVCKSRKDITFLAAGTGPQFEFYKSQLSPQDEKLIKLIGRRDDVDELFQICDISVLCTNVKVNEGLSNSIVESMAFGTPVIATNGGGTPEIIEDGINGLLIKNQTAEEVANMIVGLIDNATERKKMSIKCKKTIQNKFLLKRMTDDFIQLYSAL